MSRRSPSSHRLSRSSMVSPPPQRPQRPDAMPVRPSLSRQASVRRPSVPDMPAMPADQPYLPHPTWRHSFSRPPSPSSMHCPTVVDTSTLPRSDSLSHLPRPKRPALRRSPSSSTTSVSAAETIGSSFLDLPDADPSTNTTHRTVGGRSRSISQSSSVRSSEPESIVDYYTMSRSPSVSSSSSGQSQTIVTPLPEKEKKVHRRSKLLPAIPLTVDTSASPVPSRKSQVERFDIPSSPDEVRLVIDGRRERQSVGGMVDLLRRGDSSPQGDWVDDLKRRERAAKAAGMAAGERDVLSRQRSVGTLKKPRPITPPRVTKRSSTILRDSSQAVGTPPPPPTGALSLKSPSPALPPPPRPPRPDFSLSPEQQRQVYLPDISPRTIRRASQQSFRSSPQQLPRPPPPQPDFSSPPSTTWTSRPSLPDNPDFSSPQILLPPKINYRSVSPSDSFNSDAPTPRASQNYRPEPLPPTSSTTLYNAVCDASTSRKRDSAQRRLSALRGLVANLDFSQHWSLSDPVHTPSETGSEGEMFWACSGSLDFSHMVAANQDHGWPSTSASQQSTNRTRQTQTPPRRPTSSDLKDPRKSGTPPRKPKLTRSNSDLNVPEPPKPVKSRQEQFGVASGGYSKSLQAQACEPSDELPSSSWREGVSAATYRRVEAQGPIELKRQEVLWEMCETETAFLKSMRTVLRLFATPLKTPQGRWIDGIAPKITELFDSLEGVVHAHGILNTAERDLRRKTEVLSAASFVRVFRDWVDRLEVHEEYLLKFEKVVALVEENVRDADSVFGEFVRMQMKEEVLGNMSLGSMLLKPVQRLTKYPLFLKRLLDVTPHPHPAHADLLSLLTHTEGIIRTLQATKAREDDYDSLYALSLRLQGLPEDFQLALRGRKLLGQGQVLRVPPAALQSSPVGRSASISSRGSMSSASSAPSSPWDLQSMSSARTSAFSVSTTSSSTPSRSGSVHSYAHTSPLSGPLGRSPSSASGFERPTTPSGKRRKEDGLTMMVFDDMVLIAQPIDRGLFKKRQEGLRVLPESEGGVGRVVEVRDWSGWNGHGALFSVTISNRSGTFTIAFTVPALKAASGSPKPGSQTQARANLSTTREFLDVLAQATMSEGGNGRSEVGMRSEESRSGAGEGGEGGQEMLRAGMGEEEEVLDEVLWERVR